MTSDMTIESAFDTNDHSSDEVICPPSNGPRVTLHRQGPPHRRRVRSQSVRQTIYLEPIAFNIDEMEGNQMGLNEENLEILVVTSCDEALIASSVGDKTRCVICLQNQTSVHQIVQLQCKHTFCKLCIFQWLKEKATCPCCRDNVRRHFT